jgi:hypothetical protein
VQARQRKYSIEGDPAFLWKQKIFELAYTCQTETPQPINMKFGLIDYVGEIFSRDMLKMVGIS